MRSQQIDLRNPSCVAKHTVFCFAITRIEDLQQEHQADEKDEDRELEREIQK
jgi:hypothetical protein